MWGLMGVPGLPIAVKDSSWVQGELATSVQRAVDIH